MNELQIRLTADIKNLQTALAAATKSIKDFEKQTGEESEKGNVGFRRKIGLIEKLENQAKSLRVALRQATDETQVERYNQELQQTQKELTRLNLIGRSSINNINQGLANGTGVAIEFNRVIQDAPFGIIGIGNNIQQLAGNFSNLRAQAGSTGAALKAAFTSLVSPVNLGLLAISALTAAFTAYQMGAFDSLFANEELEKSFENLDEEIEDTVKNLNSFESAISNAGKSASNEKIQLDTLFAILQDTNLAQETRVGAYNKLVKLYPNLLEGLTLEKALTGDLTTEYNLLTAAIEKKALAEAFQGKFNDIIKERIDLQSQLTKEENIAFELQKRVAQLTNQINLAEIEGSGVAKGRIIGLKNERAELEEQLALQNRIVDLAQKTIQAQGAEAEKLKTEIIALQKELVTIFGFGDGGNGVIIPNNEPAKVQRVREDLEAINVLLEMAANIRRDEFFQGVEAPIGVESGAFATRGIITSPPVDLAQYQANSQQIIDINKVITDSFTDLGVGIVASLNISNQGLRGFLTTLVSATPRIIQAVMAQAKASEAAAAIANKGNAKQATGNAIVTATNSAKALGPIGLALLPVFIAGAVALISGAFRNAGGAGGGGGVGASASIGSTISNRPPNVGGLVSPQRGTPSFTGFDSGFGPMSIDINLRGVLQGDDIALVVDQAIIKRGNR